VITTYIDTFIPRATEVGFYTSEWKSHLSQVMSDLEASKGQAHDERGHNVRFELTFLDKGKDFIRSVRFADGAHCCFDSTNYTVQGEHGAADWIARINADPLSFVMDIKQEGSREISGFVFGRMGVDPDSEEPVVMVNGIYSQKKSPAFTNNLLSHIEAQFADRINARSILLASQHGGSLPQAPDGYGQVTNQNVRAIRALPEDTTYDDIGTTANGEFSFSGFKKERG